jgi:hypothetical protein
VGKSTEEGKIMSMKNLGCKKAINTYRDVARNLEAVKKMEKELKNELKSCSFKNFQTIATEHEHELVYKTHIKDGKIKGSFHRPSLSVCFESTNSNTWRKRSGKKNKKSSKERKNSTSRKHHNLSKQMQSMTNINPKSDERIKKIMEIVHNKENNFFKAIQLKMMNNKVGVQNSKESNTPKSNKKQKDGLKNRMSSFKAFYPAGSYSTTFSPRSFSSNKKERPVVFSPVSLKSARNLIKRIEKSKKSTSRQKNYSSKKRDSLSKQKPPVEST